MIYIFVLLLRLMFFAFAALVVASFVLVWFVWQGLRMLSGLAADAIDDYAKRTERRATGQKTPPQARYSNRR